MHTTDLGLPLGSRQYRLPHLQLLQYLQRGRFLHGTVTWLLQYRLRGVVLQEACLDVVADQATARTHRLVHTDRLSVVRLLLHPS